jgi:hypothetical protein
LANHLTELIGLIRQKVVQKGGTHRAEWASLASAFDVAATLCPKPKRRRLASKCRADDISNEI